MARDDYDPSDYDHDDYDSDSSRLERIEDGIEEIKSEVQELRGTIRSIIFFVVCGIIGALWGEQIWGFIKGAFIVVVGIVIYLFEIVKSGTSSTASTTTSSSDEWYNAGSVIGSSLPKEVSIVLLVIFGIVAVVGVVFVVKQMMKKADK